MRIYDLHCDTASKIYLKQSDFTDKTLQVDLNSSGKCDEYFQVFAMCVDGRKYIDCKKYISDMIDYFYKNITPYHNVKYMISIEGGEALELDENNVDYFYSKGVRIITPVWNYKNFIGVPSCVSDSGGITDLGKKIIRRMNSLNMIVDLSHINLQGFYECIELAERPILTHSNSYKICQNKRNITDDQFELIKNRNGIVGINFYPYFLNNTEKATIKDIINHIYHFLSIGGEDCICVGSDFDGIDFYTKDLKSSLQYNNLIEEMRKINFSEKIIAKITYKNCKNYINNYVK